MTSNDRLNRLSFFISVNVNDTLFLVENGVSLTNEMQGIKKEVGNCRPLIYRVKLDYFATVAVILNGTLCSPPQITLFITAVNSA